MFDLRNCTTLEGRILVHGEDEGTGRTFMLLEGTDAKVPEAQWQSTSRP
jgi:hypothetical protein